MSVVCCASPEELAEEMALAEVCGGEEDMESECTVSLEASVMRHRFETDADIGMLSSPYLPLQTGATSSVYDNQANYQQQYYQSWDGQDHMYSAPMFQEYTPIDESAQSGWPSDYMNGHMAPQMSQMSHNEDMDQDHSAAGWSNAYEKDASEEPGKDPKKKKRKSNKIIAEKQAEAWENVTWSPASTSWTPASSWGGCSGWEGSPWQSSNDWWPKNSANATPKVNGKDKAKVKPVAAKKDDKSSDEEDGDRPRTTVMLRDLPAGFTRDILIDTLDSSSFAGEYNFLYLPYDFESLTPLKHGFVNFFTADAAERARNWFDGRCFPEMDPSTQISVAWNERQMGLAALIERYRNSPVMHPDVPDQCKPVVLRAGKVTDFPRPTQAIKAPKIRSSRRT